MDNDIKSLAQHIDMLYKAVRSLHTIFAVTTLTARAARLTFASSPELKALYEKHLSEPLSKEEQDSLTTPLQALDLMIAMFQRQFGPFGSKPSGLN